MLHPPVEEAPLQAPLPLEEARPSLDVPWAREWSLGADPGEGGGAARTGNGGAP